MDVKTIKGGSPWGSPWGLPRGCSKGATRRSAGSPRGGRQGGIPPSATRGHKAVASGRLTVSRLNQGGHQRGCLLTAVRYGGTRSVQRCRWLREPWEPVLPIYGKEYTSGAWLWQACRHGRLHPPSQGRTQGNLLFVGRHHCVGFIWRGKAKASAATKKRVVRQRQLPNNLCYRQYHLALPHIATAAYSAPFLQPFRSFWLPKLPPEF